jgi:hypothetical protein
MKRGSGSLVFVIFIAFIVAGGYFVYKSNPQVRNWIQNTLNIDLPDEDILINPLLLARDQERREDVKAISDAIFQYTSENKGLLTKDFPTSETCIGTGSPCYNLKALLVPKFMAELPMDPKNGTEQNTKFTTFKNMDGRVVVSIQGELGGKFEIVR